MVTFKEKLELVEAIKFHDENTRLSWQSLKEKGLTNEGLASRLEVDQLVSEIAEAKEIGLTYTPYCWLDKNGQLSLGLYDATNKEFSATPNGKGANPSPFTEGREESSLYNSLVTPPPLMRPSSPSVLVQQQQSCVRERFA